MFNPRASPSQNKLHLQRMFQSKKVYRKHDKDEDDEWARSVPAHIQPPKESVLQVSEGQKRAGAATTAPVTALNPTPSFRRRTESSMTTRPRKIIPTSQGNNT